MPCSLLTIPHRTNQDTIRKVALYASVEVQPLAAYFGGVVAQEVVKVTGKYTPLNQWLHLDFLEMLPDEIATDANPTGGRYDHMVTLFGEKFVQEKIMNAKTFMVSFMVWGWGRGMGGGGGVCVCVGSGGVVGVGVNLVAVVFRHSRVASLGVLNVRTWQPPEKSVIDPPSHYSHRYGRNEVCGLHFSCIGLYLP